MVPFDNWPILEVSPPSTAHPAVLPSGGLWTQPGLRVVIYALLRWPDMTSHTLFLLGIPMPCCTSHCSPAADFALQQFLSHCGRVPVYSRAQRSYTAQCRVPGHPQRYHFKRSTSALEILCASSQQRSQLNAFELVHDDFPTSAALSSKMC